MDEEGKIVLKGFSFPNSSEGGHSLLIRLRTISDDPAHFLAGMEATGHYWLALFSFLDNADYFIHVINPIQTDGWRKGDRKSTRLNSSHVAISYAVFCLKKKKKIK